MTPHVFDHPLPKCYVIITRDIDGQNPDEEPTADSINKAIEALMPGRAYFYPTHVQGLDLLVALDFETTDERLIRDLAVLELQDME